VPLNNWFTEYWKEYIQNIYDKDSRLVTLEAKLSSHLLNKISLNDQILYKNQYYLIQSIQYDTSSERAKIELLKAVATSPVICGLTPSSYNFRGLVTFEDLDGNTTTDATLNCCKFYGFNYSSGKCYAKFDIPRPTGLANPLLNVPADNGLGQVTGILNSDLLVPVLSPTDGTVTYRTVVQVQQSAYNSQLELQTTPSGTWEHLGTGSITWLTDNDNFVKSGKRVTWNNNLRVTSVSGLSSAGNVLAFDFDQNGKTIFRLFPNDNAIFSPIGFAEVQNSISGAVDGIYHAFYGGFSNIGAGKAATGILFWDNVAEDYLEVDQFQAGTRVLIFLNYSTLYSESDPRAVPDFSVSNLTPSTSDTVNLTNTSLNNPTIFEWTITGGAYTLLGGSQLTDENISVRFDDSTTNYSITLKASNSLGTIRTTGNTISIRTT